MKENMTQPGKQEALTNKPNPPRLRGKGDIFMSDAITEQSPITTAAEAADHLAAIKQQKERREHSFDESAIEENFRMGYGREEKPDFNFIEDDLLKQTVLRSYQESFYDHGIAKKTTRQLVDEAYKKLKQAGGVDDIRKELSKSQGMDTFIRFAKSKIESGEINVEERELKGIASLSDKILRDFERIKTGEPFSAEDLLILKDALDSLMHGGEEKEGEEKTKRRGLLELLKKYETSDHEFIPRCLEDLAGLIMDSEEDKWRTGGKKELLNEKGELNTENLLAWFRSRVMYYHDRDPDDPIDLFSNVSIPTLYRSIGFGEMLAFSRYFMTRDQKMNGYEYRQNNDYDELKKHLLYEVWLFQNSHNFDVEYRKVMGLEEKVPEALGNAYYNNAFTKNRSRLLKILRLPQVKGGELRKIVLEDDENEIGSVGKEIRKGILAYNYLPDEEMFGKVLGEKGLESFYETIIEGIFEKEIKAMFKARGEKYEFGKTKVDIFEKGSRDSEEFFEFLSARLGHELFGKRLSGEQITKNEYYALLKDKKWFALKSFAYKYNNTPKISEGIRSYSWRELEDKDRDAKEDGKDGKIIFGNLNIFNQAQMEQTRIDLIRKAIEKGMNAGSDLEREDVEYAENWAYSMVYWTGIGAKNDTNAIGFDIWTKILRTKDYRLRQTEGKGIFGDLYSIFGLKRLGLNFWEAVKVKSDGETDFNMTLLEMLQGGQGDNVDLDKFRNFDFLGNAQRKFVEDHVFNAFKLYNEVLRKHGMDFDKFIKMDPVGRVSFDHVEADKVMDGIWKSMRYAFDLPGLLYDDEVRGWYKDKNGKLHFESTKIRDAMFDEHVKGMNMYERESFKSDELKYKYMARNVFAYMIAKQLAAHRKWSSGYRRYTALEVELIENYFKRYPLHVEEDEKGEVEVTEFFFNKEEWNTIAKKSNTTFFRMWGEELGFATAGGGVGGFFAGLRYFLKSLAK